MLERAAYAGYVALPGDERRVLLVYVQDDALFTAPFDVGRLEAGAGRPVVRQRSGFPSVTTAAVSRSGTLAYLPAGAVDALGDASLVWVGRDGTERALPEPSHSYGEVKLAPGGQRAVVNWRDPRTPSNVDLWFYDLDGEGLTRLTDGGGNIGAVWTPDGQRVVYSHTDINTAATGGQLKIVSADDGGPAITLVESSANWRRGDIEPSSISPDGSELLVTNDYLGTADVWVVPLDAASAATGGDVAVPRAFLASRYNERYAAFSPNARFVAYASDESGTYEIYVVPYPGPGAKSLVSRGGGMLPHWSADGRELFYLNGDQMMVADVETSAAFRARAPRARAALALRFPAAPHHKRFSVQRRCRRPVPDAQVQRGRRRTADGAEYRRELARGNRAARGAALKVAGAQGRVSFPPP